MRVQPQEFDMPEESTATPTGAERTDLNKAVAGSFAGAGEEVVETPAPTGDATTPAADGNESTEGKDKSESTETQEVTEATDGIPDKVFDIDISGLPAEEKAKVYKAIVEREDYIGKLLRAKPGEEEREAPAPEPDVEPMTDAQILEQLGIDPDGFGAEETIKVAIPLVRALEAQQTQLATLQEQVEVDQLTNYWESEFDRLERTHGELPIDRVALVEFAAANNIQSPVDAYWRVAGPAQRDVQAAVAEAEKRVAAAGGATAADKKAVSAARPKGNAAEAETPITEKNLRKATGEAASSVLKALGIGD